MSIFSGALRHIPTAALYLASLLGIFAPAQVLAPKPQQELPAVLPMRGYQQRWIDDESRMKIAVKSARIGFSFATALEAVLDCIAHPKSTWTVLSASKPQSVEFIQTCHTLLEVMHGTVELYQDESFFDELGEYEAIQQRVTLPNGSRIIALASNPRTARGYPGNAILDEFAHHQESYAIWAAITRQTSLGHKIRVLSTPNGEQGKFYDLCKEFGLTDGAPPEYNFGKCKGWSIHWIDAQMAIDEGCPINLEEMRQMIADEDIVNQEFNCIFLKATGAWLDLELIQQCEDGSATIQWPGGYLPLPAELLARIGATTSKIGAIGLPGLYRTGGELFGGIDVGRVKDRTTFWIKERTAGGVLRTIMAVSLSGVPFDIQAELLVPFVKLTRRTAIDSTGMGIALFDLLTAKAAGRVMGVNFAGSSKIRNERRELAKGTSSVEDGSVSMKVDLAIKLKRSMQSGKERLPYDLDIRTELQAIKRVPTSSGVTFDAPRVPVESAVAGGTRQRSFQHADHFWGCALSTYASQGFAVITEFTAPETQSTTSQSGGIL